MKPYRDAATRRREHLASIHRTQRSEAPTIRERRFTSAEGIAMYVAPPVSMPSRFAKFIMPTVLAALAAAGIAASLWLSGCVRTNTPTAKDPGTIVTDAITCASEPVHTMALHALDDFASALVSSDFNLSIAGVVTGLISATVATLKERAERASWQAAECAIKELHDQAASHIKFGLMDSATIQREAIMRDNATRWLEAH